MWNSRVSQRGSVRRILGPELQAVRPVDRERVDVQALKRLQHGRAGAAEERDALLDLLRLRRVLEEDDVRQRMPRADDRHAQLVACPSQLVAEHVDLGDGLLQVALVDLVGGHGRGHGDVNPFPSQRTFSLTCATHFSDWRYASDFGRRRISAVRSESRNSSGPSKRRMRTAPVADALEHVRVGACALEQPVLAGEAERLVVERVAQQARVEDLEHVDLREMPVQRRGVGDRVHAVERVREIDEPALLADGLDRLRERHPARDLLLEEEADHLALAVGLDLLAGDDDQVARVRAIDGFERAAERVVVGDRDAAEPDLLRVVEQVLNRDRAVVRPVGVHVQVDGDPVAVASGSAPLSVVVPRAPRRLRASRE